MNKVFGKIILIGVIALSSYFLSGLIMTNVKGIRIIALALVSVLVFLRSPTLLFVVGFIVITSGFGLARISFRIPGAMKNHDIGLLLCMMGGFLTVLKDFRHHLSIFNTPFTKVIIAFIFYIFYAMVATIICENQSVIMTVQIGRMWIYSVLYFAVLPVLLKYPVWQKVMKVLLVMGVISAFFYVLSSIGIGTNLLSRGHSVHHQTVGDETIRRVYGTLFNIPTDIAASALLAYLICGQLSGRKRKFGWAMLIVLTLQPLFSLGRGYMVAYFAELLTVVAFAPVVAARKIKFIISGGVLGIVLLTVISIVRFSDLTFLNALFIDRFVSAKTDFTNKTGTYEVRDLAVRDRMAYVMKSPVLGIGLIHPDSGLYPDLQSIVGTGHNGYIQILGQLGFGGLLIFILMTLLVFKTASKVRYFNIPFLYKALSLATMGYALQGYLRMFSTSSFVSIMSFVYFAVLMAIMRIAKLEHENSLLLIRADSKPETDHDELYSISGSRTSLS